MPRAARNLNFSVGESGWSDEDVYALESPNNKEFNYGEPIGDRYFPDLNNDDRQDFN